MAKRFAYGTTILGSILVFFMALLMFGFAPFLTSLLTADTEVAEVSAGLLRIVAFSEPLFAVSIVATYGALGEPGTARPLFFINLFTMWGVRVMIGPGVHPPVRRHRRMDLHDRRADHPGRRVPNPSAAGPLAENAGAVLIDCFQTYFMV